MTKKNSTILVVDDDSAILDTIYDLLSEEYQKVILASSGREALSIMDSYSPINLAVIDIMMPDMDGYHLVQEMKKSNHSIPFIFLTAKTEIQDKLIAFELGAEDYICKPFNESEFLARVKQKIYIQEKIELRNKRLALIHHNILTPTGVVQGNVQLIELWINKIHLKLESNNPDEQIYTIPKEEWETKAESFKKFIQDIYKSLNQLTKMTHNFMETFVMQNSDVTLYYSIVELGTYISGIVSYIKPKKLKFSVNNQIAKAKLRVDCDKLDKVIYELVDNSVLHNDNPLPEIELLVLRKNNLAIFTVSDNGRGIYPENFDNAFKEFWVEQDVLHHKRGEGIGLWLSKKYIELHNGQIWIEKSEKNRGTSISFSLPIYEGA